MKSFLCSKILSSSIFLAGLILNSALSFSVEPPATDGTLTNATPPADLVCGDIAYLPSTIWGEGPVDGGSPNLFAAPAHDGADYTWAPRRLSLEFATQEGMSYVVESTQDLASGQWEAITTVEGIGRHEVIEMPTTEQAQVYLRVREVSGVTQ